MVTNPKKGWLKGVGGPRMQNGQFANGQEQDFYYPDDHPMMPGWFKGSKQILIERGLYWEGMQAACENACFDNKTDKTCCCRKVLFYQPDFIAQKPQIQEYIESQGHICDYYPKFHCELNFIEQYWGAAKFRYHSQPATSDIKAMCMNVRQALDNMPLTQIRRYANCSAQFIHAYSEGLTGAEAAWANHRFHGH